MFAFNDLITPVTKEEAEASIYDVLGIVGTAVTSWKPFSPVRTMITGVSILLSAFTNLMADLARSGFLEFASGPWLRLVAVHVYGIDESVFDATFASGELTLVNAGGGVYALDPGDLVALNPTTGRTYRNTSAVSLGALATLTIPVTAVEAGADSTAPPGTITELETTLLGVTVSNGAALVGRDEMSDPEIRTLCYERLGALSPFGPWDAYTYAARTAVRSDGTLVGVTRVRTLRDGNGATTTIVATATGAVTGDANDINTDLGAVNDAIQRRAAPLAVTATVGPANPYPVAIEYRAWLYNTQGLRTSDVEALIATRLAEFASTQPIGGNVISGGTGFVYRSALAAAIASAVAPDIFRVELVSPPDDVELISYDVFTLASVTAIAIVQVAPGEGF